MSCLVAGSRMSVSGTQARSRVGRGSPRRVPARRFRAAKRCGRSSCPVTCRAALGLGQAPVVSETMSEPKPKNGSYACMQPERCREPGQHTVARCILASLMLPKSSLQAAVQRMQPWPWALSNPTWRGKTTYLPLGYHTTVSG